MIDLSFNLNDNDCELVYDDENMVMSCIRRLDTSMDSTLYTEYGSNLQGLLGLKKSAVNLEFLNQSITDCLMQDGRISDCNIESKYTDNGIVSDISITYEDNELKFEYELTGDDNDG